MPIPEKYRVQQVETRRVAEREARRDTRRAFARGIVEIIAWSLAGLLCIGLAFHTFDVQLGRIWWWLGCIVWISGCPSRCSPPIAAAGNAATGSMR